MSEQTEKHLERLFIEARERNTVYSIEVLQLKQQLAQQKALLDEACELLRVSNDGYIITSKARAFLEKVGK